MNISQLCPARSLASEGIFMKKAHYRVRLQAHRFRLTGSRSALRLQTRALRSSASWKLSATSSSLTEASKLRASEILAESTQRSFCDCFLFDATTEPKVSPTMTAAILLCLTQQRQRSFGLKRQTSSRRPRHSSLDVDFLESGHCSRGNASSQVGSVSRACW